MVNSTPPHDPLATPLGTALGRGLRRRCPCCGRGTIFQGFLTVSQTCSDCGLPLGNFRADDAPPYFVLLISGHLVLSGAFMVERAFSPSLWMHAMIWAPVIAALVYFLLPRVKGAVIGVQWKFQSRDQDPFPEA